MTNYLDLPQFPALSPRRAVIAAKGQAFLAILAAEVRAIEAAAAKGTSS